MSDDRCPSTFGVFDPVRCLRRSGHDGDHSGYRKGGRLEWARTRAEREDIGPHLAQPLGFREES